MKFLKFKNKAKWLRKETFLTFIRMGEAHLGGSFSMIELIIALYDSFIKKGDKFILSKAHASIPLCLLLKSKGLNPKISTHLEIDVKNGIHCTTGSLGHGLPISVGVALARKIKKNNNKIYVLISDGECQEGTTWESLLIASKHKLDNLIIIVDYNKIQALSKLDDALPLENLMNKFKAFNCKCINIKNGHSFKDIFASIAKAKKIKGYPSVIIANTIKGKGIKKFENDPAWHARKVKDQEMIIGKKALGII